MSAPGIVFALLLPWPLIWLGLGLAVLILVFAALRRLSGWVLRGIAARVLLAGFANPALQHEDRTPLKDIVLLVADRSSSQQLSDRQAQTDNALATISREIRALPNTELKTITVSDAPGDGGTLAMGAISRALAQEPRGRVAGVIMVTDGQIHDMAAAPDIPARSTYC